MLLQRDPRKECEKFLQPQVLVSWQLGAEGYVAPVEVYRRLFDMQALYDSSKHHKYTGDYFTAIMLVPIDQLRDILAKSTILQPMHCKPNLRYNGDQIGARCTFAIQQIQYKGTLIAKDMHTNKVLVLEETACRLLEITPNETYSFEVVQDTVSVMGTKRFMSDPFSMIPAKAATTASANCYELFNMLPNAILQKQDSLQKVITTMSKGGGVLQGQPLTEIMSGEGDRLQPALRLRKGTNDWPTTMGWLVFIGGRAFFVQFDEDPVKQMKAIQTSDWQFRDDDAIDWTVADTKYFEVLSGEGGIDVQVVVEPKITIWTQVNGQNRMLRMLASEDDKQLLDRILQQNKFPLEVRTVRTVPKSSAFGTIAAGFAELSKDDEQFRKFWTELGRKQRDVNASSSKEDTVAAFQSAIEMAGLGAPAGGAAGGTAATARPPEQSMEGGTGQPSKRKSKATDTDGKRKNKEACTGGIARSNKQVPDAKTMLVCASMLKDAFKEGFLQWNVDADTGKKVFGMSMDMKGLTPQEYYRHLLSEYICWQPPSGGSSGKYKFNDRLMTAHEGEKGHVKFISTKSKGVLELSQARCAHTDCRPKPGKLQPQVQDINNIEQDPFYISFDLTHAHMHVVAQLVKDYFEHRDKMEAAQMQRANTSRAMFLAFTANASGASGASDPPSAPSASGGPGAV